MAKLRKLLQYYIPVHKEITIGFILWLFCASATHSTNNLK